MHPKNKTNFKSLDRIAASPKVSHVEEDSDGIWIYLQPGWNFEGCSAVREDTVRSAISHFAMVEVGDPY